MREIILAGRPNSGKSTLFNRLASANQKVGNYAGCTVEKKTATVLVEGAPAFELTDLPGLYSLRPNSMDEEVALRHLEEERERSFVVFVLDGNNLEQELALPLLLKKRGYRLAIAVNMIDEVRANQKILNLAGMTELAGLSFFPVSARTGEGVEELKRFLAKQAGLPAASASPLPLAPGATSGHGSTSAASSTAGQPSAYLPELRGARAEARRLNSLNQNPRQDALRDRDSRLDAWLLHRAWGPIFFFLTMFIVFQSIFAWAAPLSDAVEGGVGLLQGLARDHVGHELLASLLADGLLAGVGSVLVFVPQIAILFLLIGLLEYSGYLPRVAFLVDRLMKPYGLDGKVFIPLLSSVACAVPGIMATRTIESERTRLITIMISPLMTCSARLPVYTLLIGTFIPNSHWGPLSLPGLVMFGMYALSVVVALAVAFVLHKLDFRQRRHVVDFIHLPHYRLPNWAELFGYVSSRVYAFLRKAGTVIAAMAFLLWVLLSFPRVQEEGLPDEVRASHQLEQSYGGQLGKALEPVFRPIGYDWKLTIGVVASLAAREVFVSTLGTVFALAGGEEGAEASLGRTLVAERKLDGRPAYTLATCLSLLVFFAFSLQCISTIGVARRETNSWAIPLVMFAYMFALAYGAAFAAFQLTSLFL